MMGLFTKKNKGCSCNKNSSTKSDIYESGDIAILGTGCPKCIELENRVNAVLDELGMNKRAKHITDMTQIARFGVMSTPALVIDDKVVSAGKMLSPSEIKGFLSHE